MKRNVLVDANNLFHRAHAIYVKDKTADTLLTNSRGYPTGLIYGVFSMLESWLQEFDNFTRIVFFMDGVPKRRLSIDETYKLKEEASTAPGRMPAEITLRDEFKARNELDIIFHIASLMGIDLYYDEHEEADDLIASFIKQNSSDINIVVSSDKDFFQILTKYPTMVLYRPGVSGRRLCDAEAAADHMNKLYGVRILPEEILMFKAMTGDPSDGIKGVPRIRKRVLAPLCYCKTIDELIGTGMPGFSKNEKKNTIELKDKISSNLELVKLIEDLNVESFKKPSQECFDVARMILKDDLDIHQIAVSSFQPTKQQKLRSSIAMSTIPDWLSDI